MFSTNIKYIPISSWDYYGILDTNINGNYIQIDFEADSDFKINEFWTVYILNEHLN